MRIIHDSIKDILGKDVVVLSAIGNHDAYPVDQFDTAPFYSWYLDAFAEEMSFWLPYQVVQQMRYAGHYTYLIRPGFRALVVNTQYADVLNFFIYKNSTDNDPGKLIDTTTQVVMAAEKAGERVIILGHIPPRGITTSWAEAMLDLGKRFPNTIIAHLYGHTHHDEFRVIRDVQGAYAVSYTAPALTTWSNQFPSVRLYKINSTNNVRRAFI
jgi:sphingomyelin phosphodiesterase